MCFSSRVFFFPCSLWSLQKEILTSGRTSRDYCSYIQRFSSTASLTNMYYFRIKVVLWSTEITELLSSISTSLVSWQFREEDWKAPSESRVQKIPSRVLTILYQSLGIIFVYCEYKYPVVKYNLQWILTELCRIMNLRGERNCQHLRKYTAQSKNT